MSETTTKDITCRLRSAEGHVRGIARMVDEGAYCVDVVNQVRAVQQALEKVSRLVLDRHLRSCVTRAVQSEDALARERVLDELLDVFQVTGTFHTNGLNGRDR